MGKSTVRVLKSDLCQWLLTLPDSVRVWNCIPDLGSGKLGGETLGIALHIEGDDVPDVPEVVVCVTKAWVPALNTEKIIGVSFRQIRNDNGAVVVVG